MTARALVVKSAGSIAAGARFVRIGDGDRLQLVAHAAAPLDRVALRKQSLRDRRADRAASE